MYVCMCPCVPSQWCYDVYYLSDNAGKICQLLGDGTQIAAVAIKDGLIVIPTAIEPVTETRCAGYTLPHRTQPQSIYI